MLDLVLACAHHLAAFALFGILFAQLVTIRPGMESTAIRRASAFDIAYGLAAALILIVGFARVSHAAKGWEYYAHNAAFWAKVGVFALIGLISIFPTIAFRRWRREGGSPGAPEVLGVRRHIHAQLVLFALLPILAAAMARGYAQF